MLDNGTLFTRLSRLQRHHCNTNPSASFRNKVQRDKHNEILLYSLNRNTVSELSADNSSSDVIPCSRWSQGCIRVVHMINEISNKSLSKGIPSEHHFFPQLFYIPVIFSFDPKWAFNSDSDQDKAVLLKMYE